MFEKSVEELTELGAQITTAEIAQQPELWRDTLNIYRENKEAIEAFLAEARAMGEGRLSVVFTGAGTSDYVGDTCAPYLRHAGNTDLYDFKPIATTDIVSAPRDFLRAEDPTLVVSFARSGNSPESLAAVAVAKELVHNVKFLNITCAPEGKLAVESADDPNALTLLIPRANDKGFAMTGSYSCMTLLSTLIFDTASDEQKAEWVETIAKMGEEVIARESEVADYLAGDFNRVTYLAPAPLAALLRRASLRFSSLLTAWLPLLTTLPWAIVTDPSPSSTIRRSSSCSSTTTPTPVSTTSTSSTRSVATRSLSTPSPFSRKVPPSMRVSPSPLRLRGTSRGLPCSAVRDVCPAISLLNSVRVGNTPDTPSPTGTVNRVVKGVTIHPFTA